MTVLSVAVGGAIGASLRYGVGLWVGRSFGPDFPLATMLVNIAGSLAMGILAVAMLHRFPETWGLWSPLVMTGILGGFTTFSAFSLDALTLVEQDRLGAAAVYVGGSVVFALLALFAGLALGRTLWP